MRNLALKLVLWLCRVFDIAVLEEARLKMEADAKARSARWEVFYREEGGLADMLDAIRREAFEAGQAVGIAQVHGDAAHPRGHVAGTTAQADGAPARRQPRAHALTKVSKTDYGDALVFHPVTLAAV